MLTYHSRGYPTLSQSIGSVALISVPRGCAPSHYCYPACFFFFSFSFLLLFTSCTHFPLWLLLLSVLRRPRQVTYQDIDQDRHSIHFLGRTYICSQCKISHTEWIGRGKGYLHRVTLFKLWNEDKRIRMLMWFYMFWSFWLTFSNWCYLDRSWDYNGCALCWMFGAELVTSSTETFLFTRCSTNYTLHTANFIISL